MSVARAPRWRHHERTETSSQSRWRSPVTLGIMPLFMLGPLFSTQLLNALSQALRFEPNAAATIAVVDQPRVGKAMAERGAAVINISSRLRSLRRHGGMRLYSNAGALPLRSGTLDALIGFGSGARDDWPELLAEWSRPVRDGGTLILVDKAVASEMTRRALCAHLAEIEQRAASRSVVTSGLVSKL